MTDTLSSAPEQHPLRLPVDATPVVHQTTEQLRTTIVAGIDSILEAPWIVQKFLSADAKRLLHAQRNFWQHDDGNQLGKLLALLQAEG